MLAGVLKVMYGSIPIGTALAGVIGELAGTRGIRPLRHPQPEPVG